MNRSQPDQWYVHAVPPGEDDPEADPGQLGPFRLPLLRVAIRNRVFTGEHHYWKEGFKDWIRGSECEELQDLFPEEVRGRVHPPEETGVPDGSREEEGSVIPVEAREDGPELKVTPHEFGQFVNFPDRWLEEHESKLSESGQPAP